jgi:predicted dienelactone hydrolase
MSSTRPEWRSSSSPFTFSLVGSIIGIWAQGFAQLQVIPLPVITPLTPAEEWRRAMLHKVGWRQGMLADDARPAWSGDGPRPIRWSAWYPADPAAEAVLVGVPPNAPLYLLGELARDAQPSATITRFPVVLLSHGTGGTAASLGWLARRLAAAGWVVLGVDHHGNTASEPYRPEGFLCWWERSRDLTVALDGLAAAGPLAGRLDPDRVVAAGFSLGGYTVLGLAGAITDMRLFQAWAEGRPGARGPREFPDLADHLPTLLATSAVFGASWERQGQSCRDQRVRAVLACAPAPTVRGFTPASLRAIDLPVAIAVGEADREAPPDDAARWLHAHLPRSSLELLGAEVGHYALLAEGTPAGRAEMPELWSDPPGVDRRAVHDRVAALALATFGDAVGVRPIGEPG